MYFAVLTPQQRKRKVDIEKLNSTKIGNRVKTTDSELVSGINLLL